MEAEEHIIKVQKERSYYRSLVHTSKIDVKDYFSEEGVFMPPTPNCQLPSNSTEITVHYSFDFAQQVHYPSDPQQPGPLYFLTPRKCAVFGSVVREYLDK